MREYEGMKLAEGSGIKEISITLCLNAEIMLEKQEAAEVASTVSKCDLRTQGSTQRTLKWQSLNPWPNPEWSEPGAPLS